MQSIFRLITDENPGGMFVVSKGCDGCKTAKQACDRRRPCGRCKGSCTYSQPGYTVLRTKKSRRSRYANAESISLVANLDLKESHTSQQPETSSNVAQLRRSLRRRNVATSESKVQQTSLDLIATPEPARGEPIRIRSSLEDLRPVQYFLNLL